MLCAIALVGSISPELGHACMELLFQQQGDGLLEEPQHFCSVLNIPPSLPAQFPHLVPPDHLVPPGNLLEQDYL